VSHSLGDSERATELYEESMDLFREQGDKHSLAYCLINLAMMVCSRGDLGRAAQLTEEGVALFRELKARGDVALGLYNLGWIALIQNDLGRAADLYRESLSLSWDAGLNRVVQSALEGFACVTGLRGETEQASSCGEQRRPYTKQRAFQEIPTSSLRLTLAFQLCARAWERKRGGRRGERAAR